MKQATINEERKGVKTIAVNAGKDETHARRFYEKNGFEMVKEVTINAPWGKRLDLATYHLQLY